MTERQRERERFKERRTNTETPANFDAIRRQSSVNSVQLPWQLARLRYLLLSLRVVPVGLRVVHKAFAIHVRAVTGLDG